MERTWARGVRYITLGPDRDFWIGIPPCTCISFEFRCKESKSLGFDWKSSCNDIALE